MSPIQRNVTGRRARSKHAPEGAPTAEEEDNKSGEGDAFEKAGDDKVEGRRNNKVEDRRPQRPPVAGSVHISGPALCARYGIVGMTLHRWERSKKLGFPKPRWINHRKYWVLSEIEAWERARAPRTGTAD